MEHRRSVVSNYTTRNYEGKQKICNKKKTMSRIAIKKGMKTVGSICVYSRLGTDRSVEVLENGCRDTRRNEGRIRGRRISKRKNLRTHNIARETFGLAGAGQSFSVSFSPTHTRMHARVYSPSCVSSSISWRRAISG